MITFHQAHSHPQFSVFLSESGGLALLDSITVEGSPDTTLVNPWTGRVLTAEDWNDSRMGEWKLVASPIGPSE